MAVIVWSVWRVKSRVARSIPLVVWVSMSPLTVSPLWKIFLPASVGKSEFKPDCQDPLSYTEHHYSTYFTITCSLLVNFLFVSMPLSSTSTAVSPITWTKFMGRFRLHWGEKTNIPYSFTLFGLWMATLNLDPVIIYHARRKSLLKHYPEEASAEPQKATTLPQSCSFKNLHKHRLS